MPDLAQPVPLWFIIATVAALLSVTALGIVAVHLAKKAKETV